MKLKLCNWERFQQNLPKKERMISGQYDEESIIVYQAYNPSISDFAIANQHFGGEHFKMERMTWIKPNFLWMMHRSGWSSKANQEKVLAIRIRISFFRSLLEEAVLSSFNSKLYKDNMSWKEDIAKSKVRIQWDPAYDIYDNKQTYRAIQIGMKGKIARQYAQSEILEIIDMSNFSKKQKHYILSKNLSQIQLPEEKVWNPAVPISNNFLLDS